MEYHADPEGYLTKGDSHLDNPNSLRIMVSSDNHLGYKEKDAELGPDSFRVFEEMLETANARNVDFVLLGGDLFHEMSPSAKTYNKTSHILNKQVFGNLSPGKNLNGRSGLESQVNFET